MRTCHFPVPSLEGSLQGITRAQEGECFKNSAIQPCCLYIWLALWDSVCTTFKPIGPHLVKWGDIRHSYNSTSFTKTSDYILETKFLSHVSTTAAAIAAVSTPHLFALKQPPRNWDLTYEPSIWKELLLKLAVNSEVQTTSRPATVTCLHPNAGLFVLAPALGYAALSLRCQHNQSWIWTQEKRYLV